MAALPLTMGCEVKRRYHFLRHQLGCGVVTAAFIAVINEFSDLPANKVGVMHIIWTMQEQTNG